MRMTRLFAVLIGFLLLCSLFAGCGVSPGDDGSANASPKTSPSASQSSQSGGNGKSDTPISFVMISDVYDELMDIHEDAGHGEEINTMLADLAPVLLAFTGPVMSETMLMISDDGGGKYNVNGTYGEISGSRGKLVRTDAKAVYEKNTPEQGSFAAYNDKAEFSVADAQCRSETELFEDGAVYRREVAYMKYKDGAIVGFHQFNSNGLKKQGDDGHESAVTFFVLTDKRVDWVYAYNGDLALDDAFFEFDHTMSVADMKAAFTAAGYKITRDSQLVID